MPQAIVLHNKQVLPGCYRLGLDWMALSKNRAPSLARNKDSLILSAQPSADADFQWDAGEVIAGQFAMIRVADSFDPFLRRPFGVYDATKTGTEILYKVVGRGTSIMSELKSGDKVDVLGPLGNGFPLDIKTKDVLMVAGGMGMVPFYLFAKGLLKKKVNVRLFYGAKTKAHLSIISDIKRLGINTDVITEDGSCGRKGLVTELLKRALKGNPVVYACGPIGMLKEVSGITKVQGVKSFVSLERIMACGIGACLGCAVRTKNHDKGAPYRMVCSEGPVFKSEDIEWEAF